MKCKNCVHLRIMHELSKGKEEKYTWCPVRCYRVDVEIERDCDKYECMTNADRIRNMTDEELAEWILEKDDNWENICKQCKTDTYCEDDIDCKIAILNWLQKEVE